MQVGKSRSNEMLVVDGVRFPAGTALVHAQLSLFRYAPRLQKEPYWRPSGKPSEFPYTGQGRASHAWELAKIFQLPFEKHDFSEKAVAAFSENTETAICGGGGTSKSTAASFYAFLFWLCAANETAVLVVSTSIDAARKRLWKTFSEFYSHACRLTGGLGESVMLGAPKPHIRSSPKDMAHGVFVIPVAQGDVQRAIDMIKGWHAKRLLIIGDETDAISRAVRDVTSNLAIGAEEFQAIWLGNLPSLFNTLGGIMQPAPGQPVSEELGVEWTSISGVKCLRFDGEDSPNIRDNNKWTGLVRKQDIDVIVEKWGRNSLHYWTMVRGLPAPEGVSNTVITESTLTRFHCYESVTWKSGFTSSCLLDPAFGGDRCTLRRIDRGTDTDGAFRVLYHPPTIIRIDVTDRTTPAEYQISKAVITFCTAHNIPPEEFIGDGTGTGRGALAVLQREWSPKVNVCEFGGAASERIVSEEDPRPASDQYDRRVTELYFAFREYVHADIIRGLDPETAQEFCQREFELKAKKTSVKTKAELKSHGYPSPDLADNAILGPELLRIKGHFASIQTPAKANASAALDQTAQEYDFDSAEDSYGEVLADF